MNYKDKVNNMILEKISRISRKIREIEDIGSTNHIDISSDLAYTVLVGRKFALLELLEDLRSLSVDRKN